MNHETIYYNLCPTVPPLLTSFNISSCTCNCQVRIRHFRHYHRITILDHHTHGQCSTKQHSPGRVCSSQPGGTLTRDRGGQYRRAFKIMPPALHMYIRQGSSRPVHCSPSRRTSPYASTHMLKNEFHCNTQDW
ncbi:hypothetical protein E2C01_021643 [Portunus trituberculatus]|uniref:Uncharacterized protein n=1 Tax=Portunus trituberculatus TaxID=210409 RepID=A0A5B7E3W2_PORTR|nr:hypothetical protein [Portunus trituberculatus]